MKTKFIVLSLLTFIFVSCGGGGKGTSSSQSKSSTSISYDDALVKPIFVNAYIDVSSSMKGYFSKQSDGRFITAVSNANPDHLFWMDRRFTELRGIPTNQLLIGEFKGGDSYFHTMLGNVIKRDSLGKSGGVSLLFTDGIISASSNETKNNPEYTRQSFRAFQNEITKVIKNADGSIAIAIFMLKSKYNGRYYDYRNIPTSVIIADRPFYIIAIGNPANIRHYVKNNKLEASLTESFGIYDTMIENAKGSIFKPLKPSNWDNDKFIGKELELSLQLPNYVSEIGKEYILSNIVIEFNGKDVTDKIKNKSGAISINGNSLRIENWSTNDTKMPVIRTGENILKVEIKKAINQSWEEVYSEDDKNIQSAIIEQGKTFALKYLIDGIKLGVEENETSIFISEKKFTK